MDNFWTKNESAFVHGFRTQKALFLSIFLFLLKKKGQRTKRNRQLAYVKQKENFFCFSLSKKRLKNIFVPSMKSRKPLSHNGLSMGRNYLFLFRSLKFWKLTLDSSKILH